MPTGDMITLAAITIGKVIGCMIAGVALAAFFLCAAIYYISGRH